MSTLPNPLPENLTKLEQAQTDAAIAEANLQQTIAEKTAEKVEAETSVMIENLETRNEQEHEEIQDEIEEDEWLTEERFATVEKNQMEMRQEFGEMLEKVWNLLSNRQKQSNQEPLVVMVSQPEPSTTPALNPSSVKVDQKEVKIKEQEPEKHHRKIRKI